MNKPHITRSPAGSKQAKQAASANSTGARRERNKYARTVDANRAAEIAKHNRKVAATPVPWKYQLKVMSGGMQLVSPRNKVYDGNWVGGSSLPYIDFAGVAYPRQLAIPAFTNETALEIVIRILSYLNGEI